MSGEERRSQLLTILRNSRQPVSGDALAKQLEVSRQVIVQDIALIRASLANENAGQLLSTHRGYVLNETQPAQPERILKVIHTDEQIQEELNAIVDMGGYVQDVFVYHKVYGVLRAPLGLKSRKNVDDYLKQIRAGISTPLMKVTSGYHYHTVRADDEETLDLIQEDLQKRGFLAPLRDYEPVDFWKSKED